MPGVFDKLKLITEKYRKLMRGVISEEHITQLKINVEAIITEVKNEIAGDFYQIKDDLDRKRLMNDLQTHLTMISNEFYPPYPGEIKIAGYSEPNALVRAVYFGLLEHIRQSYPSYFNSQLPLPKCYNQHAATVDPAGQKGIAEQLIKLGIDKSLTAVIGNYLSGEIHAQVKNWHQWDYRLRLTDRLKTFSSVPFNGDATLELLKLLIAEDFNSIHLYAFCLRYMEAITSHSGSFQEQQEELLYLMKVVRQVRVDATIPYDMDTPQLKTTLIEGISAEIDYLTEKDKLASKTFKVAGAGRLSRFYFEVMITLAELMFLIRVMLEVGMIKTKFKSHLYEFVSAHIKTQRSVNPSKKAMRNHFSSKYLPDRAVRNVREWLWNMVRHIDQHYTE